MPRTWPHWPIIVYASLNCPWYGLCRKGLNAIYWFPCSGLNILKSTNKPARPNHVTNLRLHSLSESQFRLMSWCGFQTIYQLYIPRHALSLTLLSPLLCVWCRWCYVVCLMCRLVVFLGGFKSKQWGDCWMWSRQYSSSLGQKELRETWAWGIACI